MAEEEVLQTWFLKVIWQHGLPRPLPKGELDRIFCTVVRCFHTCARSLTPAPLPSPTWWDLRPKVGGHEFLWMLCYTRFPTFIHCGGVSEVPHRCVWATVTPSNLCIHFELCPRLPNAYYGAHKVTNSSC
jgi:hypothetical protein